MSALGRLRLRKFIPLAIRSMSNSQGVLYFFSTNSLSYQEERRKMAKKTRGMSIGLIASGLSILLLWWLPQCYLRFLVDTGQRTSEILLKIVTLSRLMKRTDFLLGKVGSLSYEPL